MLAVSSASVLMKGTSVSNQRRESKKNILLWKFDVDSSSISPLRFDSACGLRGLRILDFVSQAVLSDDFSTWNYTNAEK